MKITTKSRYAVMAMADMFCQIVESQKKLDSDKKEVLVSAAQIAERQNIDIQYLEQILNVLKKKNLIGAVKGPGGGYYLEKNPEEIYLWDIIKATEEQIKMTRCNNEGFCIVQDAGPNLKCLTHNLWKGLSHHIQKYFESITLADLHKHKNNKSFYENLLIEVS